MKIRTFVQMFLALVTVGAMSFGCSALLGIDDLPPEASDGGPLSDSSPPPVDATLSDAETAEDASVDGAVDGASDAAPICDFDATTPPDAMADPNNCGPCGAHCTVNDAGYTATCFNGSCGVAVVASTVDGYVQTDASGGFPIGAWQQLAVSTDGSVLEEAVDTGGSGARAWLVGGDGGTLLILDVSHPTIRTPFEARTDPPYIFGGTGVFYANATNGDFDGKCSYQTSDPNWAVDSNGLVWRVGSDGDLVDFNVDNASVCSPVVRNTGESSPPSTVGKLPLYIASQLYAYSIEDTGIVDQWDLNTPAWVLRTGIPSAMGAVGGAIGSDSAFVFAYSNEIGVVGTDGVRRWSADAVAGQPVLTGSTDLIIAQTSATTLSALHYTDGSLAWTFALGGPYAGSFVVGNDGLIWAVVQVDAGADGGAADEVIVALDVMTGTVHAAYSGFHNVVDMLLEGGALKILQATGAGFASLPVSSPAYDPASPWPVYGHDNQRTFDSKSTLAY